MSWHTAPLGQNGNSVRTWTISAGGGRTRKDNIVVGPESGSSYIEIERIRVRATPLTYLITTRVTGAGAVVFRFWAEEMND